MTDQDQDSEPGRGEPGNDQTPLPEPWFIRDLRESRAASVKPPQAAEHVLGPAERLDEPPLVEPAGGIADDLPEAGDRPRTWLYALAGGLAAVVALVIWLAVQPRTGGADSVATTTSTVTPAATVAAAVPATAPTGLCTDPATLDRLRSLVVSDAARGGGDPDALARASAGLSLSVAETPDASGEAGAVACRGWLSLAQPGAASATAPISFRALPAGGGEARLSIVQGTAPIVAALVATGGAALAADDGDNETGDRDDTPGPPITAAAPAAAPFAPPAPQPRYSNPSFDCRRVTSWANRAICANDSLAALDRSVNAAFNDAAQNADPDTRDDLEDGRHSFLARVQRCDDEDCLADVYNDRIDELRRYR